MENPVKNELTDYDSKFVAINRVRLLNRLWRHSLTYYVTNLRFSLMRICEIYRLKAKMRTQTELLSIYKYSPPFCVITWLWVTPPRAPKPPPQHHYTSRGTSMRRCTISHNESYKKNESSKNPSTLYLYYAAFFYAICPHKGQKVIFDLFFDENLIEISKIWTKVIV